MARSYGSVVWWKTLAVLMWRHFRNSDPGAGLRIVQAASHVFCPEYRFSEHQLDWYRDKSFNAYLDRFDEWDKLNAARRWMVRELLRATASVPGDTAECGVFEGAGSWLICASNAGTAKVHHIFDSFEGLSEPGAGDGTHWSRGDLTAGEDIVRRNLAQFDAIRLYKGWIPTRFSEVADKTFSFVHVDVDLEIPTADCIAFFYPRMSPGGVLLCDDYGFASCPGATRVFDELMADKPERVLSMPAGGGFIVKGMAIQPSTALPVPRR
jgi:O-methyltransferase